MDVGRALGFSEGSWKATCHVSGGLPPAPAAFVDFHLTPLLVQPLTHTLPSFPKTQSCFKSPHLHPSVVAPWLQGVRWGKGDPSCSSQSLLSAPNLTFHGAGGTPEPLQGSGSGVGDLVASRPLPQGTLNCSVWFSRRVNEPLSTFRLSNCCQVFWSTAVSLFSLCKFISFFISLLSF